MKKAILGMIVFSAAASYSCPNLNGRWECKKSTGQVYQHEVRVFGPEGKKRITFRYDGGFTLGFTANGQRESISMPGVQMFTTTVCSDYGYTQSTDISNSQNGGTVATHLDLKLEQTSDTEYTQSTTGTMTISYDGQSETEDTPPETESCKKL